MTKFEKALEASRIAEFEKPEPEPVVKWSPQREDDSITLSKEQIALIIGMIQEKESPEGIAYPYGVPSPSRHMDECRELLEELIDFSNRADNFK